MPLSAKLKQGVTQTQQTGHALICYAAPLLSLRENRNAATAALPSLFFLQHMICSIAADDSRPAICIPTSGC